MLRSRRVVLCVAAFASSAAANAQSPPIAAAKESGSEEIYNDWPTWGYDEERSAWNRGERALGKDNVASMKVQWKTKLPTPVRDLVLSTLTAPVVAAGVSTAAGLNDLLFVMGSDDVLYAMDVASGAVAWKKEFSNPVESQKVATWLCPNTPNATPVIDKKRGIIYILPSDGKLRGLSLSDGAERLKPVEMVAPFARAWSLNLIDDVVYTTSGRACGEVQDPRSDMAAAVARLPRPPSATDEPAVVLDPSAVTAVDIADPDNPEVTQFFTSGGRPAGAWGRGALARGPDNTVILETSDGLYDPGSGNWGDTILKLTPRAARVADSFTPENHRYIYSKDLGGSASPVVFPFDDKTLVATAQKEGFLYILDANDMGGGAAANHAKPVYRSPQLGNDLAAGTDPGSGVWGAISTYFSPSGGRFLYVPMWGPPSTHAPRFQESYGEAPNGSIMAFQVVNHGEDIAVVPVWRSLDLVIPDPPAVANGVVYATSTGGQVLQNPINADGTRVANSSPEAAQYRSTPVDNLILYALDAETGEQLYSSDNEIDSWVHFGQPVVALGKVFLVTHDAEVYAFGIDQ